MAKLRTGGFIYNLDEQSQYPIKYIVCGKRPKTYWCGVCNNVFKLCCYARWFVISPALCYHLFSTTRRELRNYGSQNPFSTGLRLDSEFTGGLASREKEHLWSPGQQQTQRDLCPPRAGSWHHQHLPLIPTLLTKVFIQLCLKCIRRFLFS